MTSTMGLISGKFFECGIFISRRFYWRGAVYLMNYAIYTVDNILLLEGPLFFRFSSLDQMLILKTS